MSTDTPDVRTTHTSPWEADLSFPPLPLAPLPEGLVARAMAHVVAEAEAGRARQVLPLDAPVRAAPAPHRYRPHLGLPFLPTVLGLTAIALVATGGFAAVWIWRIQDPLSQAQFLLNLRQSLFDLRLALHLEPVMLLAIAVVLSGLGLAAAALADRSPSQLQPVSRQV